MSGNEYEILDNNGDLIGEVTGDLRALLKEVPAWEDGLGRTLERIIEDNDGYIEDLDGKIVYDGGEVL